VFRGNNYYLLHRVGSNKASRLLKTFAPSKKIAVVLRALAIWRLVPVLCVGVLLLNTFRLYKGGAYFWLDDFNNLFWAQRASFAQMLGQIVNPVPVYFRPVGMMCYWLLLRLFGLNSAAYHWLAWSLHIANTALVYFVLKRFTNSRAGAAVGAMLFASQPVFADLYWDFGTIFELVATFFSFIGILLWTTERRNWWHVILASLALLLAMKGKEIAIATPLAWLGYDLLLRKNMVPRLAVHWALPIGLALWYGLAKAWAMRGVVPTDPYYMSITAPAFAAGLRAYCNLLFRTNFPWQSWFIGLGMFLLLCLLLRSRLALFFEFYIFITFLPVIFLINHRYAFYWYLPFLGMAGLVAILAKEVADLIETRNPRGLAKAGEYSVFAMLCWAMFLVHKESNRPQRSEIRNRANEYRAFITGLRALPEPPRDETIYFDSRPSLFNEGLLLSATQVAFGRTDLRAKLVSEFPPEARYRLRFQQSRLTQFP
jgi:hypothetical protein